MDSTEKDEVVCALQAEVKQLQESMLVVTEILIPALIKAGNLTNDAVDLIGQQVMRLQGIEPPSPIVRH